MGRTDRFALVPSPLGPLLLTASPAGLRGLYVAGERGAPATDPSWQEAPDAFGEVTGQLDAYFAGALDRFEVPLDLVGTPFQLEVWRALLDVPHGRTTTYGELARRIGRPHAPRAVGAANGRNPVSIIVPCHRVVGADGGLTGYGWGLERKRYLLDLEATGTARPVAPPPAPETVQLAGAARRLTPARLSTSADTPSSRQAL